MKKFLFVLVAIAFLPIATRATDHCVVPLIQTVVQPVYVQQQVQYVPLVQQQVQYVQQVVVQKQVVQQVQAVRFQKVVQQVNVQQVRQQAVRQRSFSLNVSSVRIR
jgi:hypothetical protein